MNAIQEVYEIVDANDELFDRSPFLAKTGQPKIKYKKIGRNGLTGD